MSLWTDAAWRPEGELRQCCLRGPAGSVELAAQPLSISSSGSLELDTSALPRRGIGGVFPICWHRSSGIVFFSLFWPRRPAAALALLFFRPRTIAAGGTDGALANRSAGVSTPPNAGRS